jgi:hypothetical protein
MPITNIIDNRKRQYRYLHCDVVIEPTCHDNSCEDSDQSELQELWPMGYADKPNCTLTEAIAWAQSFPGENTLFIYDAGTILEKIGDKYKHVTTL